MSSRYWVGGSGYWNDTAHWASSSGGAGGQTVPSSSDVVTLDSNSGTSATVTVNVSANANTITINKSDITLLHNAGSTVVGAVTLTAGTLNTNGQTCSWGRFVSSNSNARALTLGASTITLTASGALVKVWDIGITTNMTLSALSSTIISTGNRLLWDGGTGLGYGSVSFTGGGSIRFQSMPTFTNLTYTGIASKTDELWFQGNTTISGNLTINGNSAINRVLVQTQTTGTNYTITCNGTISISNCDFQDITGAGSASWDLSAITGGSGDCGGNSNITFTTPADQHWISASGGNHSDVTKWTSRVPLPQDNFYFDNAFSASQTVVADMPRLGKSVDWTGATGTPTYSINGIDSSVFGSITLISAMSISQGATHSLRGRGNHTITSAGKTWGNVIFIYAVGGTYTQQDAFISTSYWDLRDGTWNTNNFNITAVQFASNGSTRTRALIGGTSVFTQTITGVDTGWQFGTGSTSTGLTLSMASATVVISTASANRRYFNGGGYTYGTLTYNVAGSTGKLTVQGTNTFTNINFSDANNARTLELKEGQTQTILNSFNVQGTSGKLMSVVSATPGTPATLSKASGIVSCDYLSVKDSTAQGGAGWYAGTHSTNVSGNSGWVFTDPPILPKSSSVLMNKLSLRNLQRI